MSLSRTASNGSLLASSLRTSSFDMLGRMPSYSGVHKTGPLLQVLGLDHFCLSGSKAKNSLAPTLTTCTLDFVLVSHLLPLLFPLSGTEISDVLDQTEGWLGSSVSLESVVIRLVYDIAFTGLVMIAVFL